MNLNRGSDHMINQVFLLWRQRALYSQSGHLLTSFSCFSFLRGCNLLPPFVPSFLRGCNLLPPFVSSFLRGCYLIGYFSTNRLAITSRCSSLVPPPMISSGASR